MTERSSLQSQQIWASFGGRQVNIVDQRVFEAVITPDEARALLAFNTANRRVKQQHLSELTRDLLTGRWSMNGDAIRFDVETRCEAGCWRPIASLVDGQHRLLACAASGVPMRTVVITGLSPEARDTIDQGVKRTKSDVLSLYGVPNATKTAAVARALLGYSDGTLHLARLTAGELRTLLEHHPRIQDVSTRCYGPASPGATVTALYYAGLADGHVDQAEAWRRVWEDGVPDYANDPAHLLRERFIREKTSTVKVKIIQKHLLLLNAWLAFCERRPLKVVKTTTVQKLPGWSRGRLGLLPLGSPA